MRLIIASCCATSLWSCAGEPAGLTVVPVGLRIEFVGAPTTLATIEAILSQGSTTASIPLGAVAGTSGAVWSGSGGLAEGTWTVVIEAKDAAATVIYRGGGSIVVSAGADQTFLFALACVHSSCQSGSSGFLVFVPSNESEPNNSSVTANTPTLWSVLGGSYRAMATNGSISSTSDEDYFAMTLSVQAGDTVVVDVLADRVVGGSAIPNRLSDGEAYLYDGSGNQLGYSDQAVGNDPRIIYEIPSNQVNASFIVRVKSWASNSSGAYTAWVYVCRSTTGVRCMPN